MSNKEAQRRTFWDTADFGYIRQHRKELKSYCSPTKPVGRMSARASFGSRPSLMNQVTAGHEINVFWQKTILDESDHGEPGDSKQGLWCTEIVCRGFVVCTVITHF